MSEILEFPPQPAPLTPARQAADAALPTVAVVGLGYVGLPVATAFGKERRTIGYDLSRRRIESLRHQVDATGEMSTTELMASNHLRATTDPAELGQADFIIVAVPTPINAARQPELAPLEAASETVGRHMKQGAVVIYESTVYPGCTEEVCVPILEKHSGMRWRQDFHVGYSPERINPGDREHTFTRILKWCQATTPRRSKRSPSSTPRWLRRGSTARRRSRSPRRRRRSRTPSATSTSLS